MIRQRTMTDERGAVLVTVLLLMMIMSIIGAAAIMMSSTDIKVSHNIRVARQAFYAADGGVEMSPKIVSAMIIDAAAPNLPNVAIHGGLYDEVMGYATEDDSTDSVSPDVNNPDLEQDLGSSNVVADIDRTGTGYMAGGGVEFGAGAEGIGVGSAGGVLIYYAFDVVSTSAHSSKSHLDARYRKVVGVAGGK